MDVKARRPHGASSVGTVLSGLSGVGIMALILICVADVARRAVTGKSIPGALEVTETALVAMVFLGMMGAQLSGRHIRTPILVNRLPARVSHLVRGLVMVLAIGFVLWMVKETGSAGLDSYERDEFRFGLVHVPVWPAKLVIPLGLLALAVAMARDAVIAFHNFVRGAPAATVDVESSL